MPKQRTRSDVDTETSTWARAIGLQLTKPKWRVEVKLDVKDEPASAVYCGDVDTRAHLAVYPDEWGLQFVHEGKSSHVRRCQGRIVRQRLRSLPAARTHAAAGRGGCVHSDA